MKFMFVILLIMIFSFISALFSLKYKTEKAKKEKAEKELKDLINQKSKKELMPVELTLADKKFLFKIFREKISYISFIKNIKQYFLIYNKNDLSLSGINKDYDIIKVEIRKMKLNKDILFNASIKAWKKESDFKKNADPDKEVVDLLCKKEFFNNQILAALSKFFINPSSKKNDLKNKLSIDND